MNLTEQIRVTRSRAVSREYKDSDGYWIELKPGYQNGSDPGTHSIVEDTKGKAVRQLASVIPCNCAECTK
jgi:hypothetical protein